MPETGESQRQRGRTKREKKDHRRGEEERKTKRQGPRHPGPEIKESKRQRGRAGRKKEKKRGGEGKQGEGNQRTKKGASPAWRGPSKAERQSGRRKRGGVPKHTREAGPPDPARKDEHTHTHVRDPGVASSDPQGEVSSSTRNSPGASAESPVARRTVREIRRVSDRVDTRQLPQRKQPKTDAGGTRQGRPHRGAPNGYDAERAQRPCLGGGQRQAQ